METELHYKRKNITDPPSLLNSVPEQISQLSGVNRFLKDHFSMENVEGTTVLFLPPHINPHKL